MLQDKIKLRLNFLTYNPGQKVLGHLPFFTWLCMEFAANLQYTLINTALTRFFPHPPPKQSWGP